MALLSRGVKANLLDRDGWTPFDLAEERIQRSHYASVHSELSTWGANDNFVLGHERGSNRSVPEKVAKLSNDAPLSVSHVVFAKYHTVILAEGQVFTCGFGRYAIAKDDRRRKPGPG